jgi:hypothetical protein
VCVSRPYRPPPTCYSRHQQQRASEPERPPVLSFIFIGVDCIVPLRKERSWTVRGTQNHRQDVECSRWRRLEIVRPSKHRPSLSFIAHVHTACFILVAIHLGCILSFSYTPPSPLLSPRHEFPRHATPHYLCLLVPPLVHTIKLRRPSIHIRYRVQPRDQTLSTFPPLTVTTVANRSDCPLCPHITMIPPSCRLYQPPRCSWHICPLRTITHALPCRAK